MFITQKVVTPYGPGTIEELRHPTGNGDESMVIVRPNAWVLANNQKPIFYLNSKDVRPLYPIGCIVVTVFGIGEINDVRDDGIYVVRLKNWILANNSSPTLYFNEASLSLYVKKDESKQPTESENDRNVRQAAKVKNEANEHFKEGEFEEAKAKYFEAITILRDTRPDASNEDRAKMLEQLIPCNNNIALCSFKTKDYAESTFFANNVRRFLLALSITPLTLCMRPMFF
jgi:hypothetical protein